jgi:hypothetical protein
MTISFPPPHAGQLPQLPQEPPRDVGGDGTQNGQGGEGGDLGTTDPRTGADIHGHGRGEGTEGADGAENQQQNGNAGANDRGNPGNHGGPNAPGRGGPDGNQGNHGHNGDNGDGNWDRGNWGGRGNDAPGGTNNGQHNGNAGANDRGNGNGNWDRGGNNGNWDRGNGNWDRGNGNGNWDRGSNGWNGGNNGNGNAGNGNASGGLIGGLVGTLNNVVGSLLGQQNATPLPGQQPSFPEQGPRNLGDQGRNPERGIDMPRGGERQGGPPQDVPRSGDAGAAGRTAEAQGRATDAQGRPDAQGRAAADAQGRAATDGQGRATIAQQQAALAGQILAGGLLKEGQAGQNGQQAATKGENTNQAQAGTLAMAAGLLAEQAPGQLASSAGAAAMPRGADEATLPQTAAQQQTRNPGAEAGKDLSQLRQPANDQPRELRNNQPQTLADPRRAETMDPSLAKSMAEAQTRTLADTRQGDPRMANMLARGEAEGKLAQEGADKAKNANQNDPARAAIGDEARQRARLAMSGGGVLTGSAARQALDWVGQQVREWGFDAKGDAEGVHAMRVVAGLIVASVAVLVVIAVLYALRLGFVA